MKFLVSFKKKNEIFSVNQPHTHLTVDS